MEFHLFQVHQKVEPKLEFPRKKRFNWRCDEKKPKRIVTWCLLRPGVTEASLALGGQEAGRPGLGNLEPPRQAPPPGSSSMCFLIGSHWKKCL